MDFENTRLRAGVIQITRHFSARDPEEIRLSFMLWEILSRTFYVLVDVIL